MIIDSTCQNCGFWGSEHHQETRSCPNQSPQIPGVKAWRRSTFNPGAHSLASSSEVSPVEGNGLPEGCPTELMWGDSKLFPRLHNRYENCEADGCTPVEIHPVGTRDRLRPPEDYDTTARSIFEKMGPGFWQIERANYNPTAAADRRYRIRIWDFGITRNNHVEADGSTFLQAFLRAVQVRDVKYPLGRA